MCLGVSVSNSVMMVTFMDEHWKAGKPSIEAALLGASERLRPILMTACAMTVGMVPMALALERGSQMEAPLGRAVIGGLVMSTFATLLVLPSIFALVIGRQEPRSPSLYPGNPQSGATPTHRPPQEAAATGTAERAPYRGSRRGGRHLISQRRLTLWVCAIMAVSGCGEEKQIAPSVLDPPELQVIHPQLRDIKRLVGQPSFVQAYERSSIYPKMTGYIEQWNVDIGDAVQKGDVLAELFVPELREEYGTKTADVGYANEKVRVAVKDVEVASADVTAARRASTRRGRFTASTKPK